MKYIKIFLELPVIFRLITKCPIHPGITCMNVESNLRLYSSLSFNSTDDMSNEICSVKIKEKHSKRKHNNQFSFYKISLNFVKYSSYRLNLCLGLISSLLCVVHLLHTYFFRFNSYAFLFVPIILFYISLCVVVIRYASFCIEIFLFCSPRHRGIPSEIVFLNRCDPLHFVTRRSKRYFPLSFVEIRCDKIAIIHCSSPKKMATYHIQQDVIITRTVSPSPPPLSLSLYIYIYIWWIQHCTETAMQWLWQNMRNISNSQKTPHI